MANKFNDKFKIVVAIFGLVLIFIMVPIGILFSLNYYNLNTSQWREYKNDEYAFSIKYPQGSWEINENESLELNLDLDSGDGIDAPKHIIWIKAVKSSLPLDDFFCRIFC